MEATQKFNQNGQFHNECICGLGGLAEYLGVCVKTAFNIKKSKRIPYYQIGRKIYFKESEILEAMSSKTSENLNGK